jgi:hypothetical protein
VLLPRELSENQSVRLKNAPSWQEKAHVEHLRTPHSTRVDQYNQGGRPVLRSRQTGIQLRDSAGLTQASPLLPVTSGTMGTLMGIVGCVVGVYHYRGRKSEVLRFKLWQHSRKNRAVTKTWLWYCHSGYSQPAFELVNR